MYRRSRLKSGHPAGYFCLPQSGRSGKVSPEGDAMNRGKWQELIREVQNATYQFGVIGRGSPVYRVNFDAGPTNQEVAACERQFGFRFPPDLREFLQQRFRSWGTA
jgi:hypothetical protein